MIVECQLSTEIMKGSFGRIGNLWCNWLVCSIWMVQHLAKVTMFSGSGGNPKQWKAFICTFLLLIYRSTPPPLGPRRLGPHLLRLKHLVHNKRRLAGLEPSSLFQVHCTAVPWSGDVSLCMVRAANFSLGWIQKITSMSSENSVLSNSSLLN